MVLSVSSAALFPEEFELLIERWRKRYKSRAGLRLRRPNPTPIDCAADPEFPWDLVSPSQGEEFARPKRAQQEQSKNDSVSLLKDPE